MGFPRERKRTFAVLLQSGLDETLWTDSISIFTAVDKSFKIFESGRKTSYEGPFGVPFEGPVTSLEAMIEYHFVSAKDLSRMHRFGPWVLSDKFFRYALHAEENLERKHHDRRHWGIGTGGRNAERLNAKDVLTSTSGEKFSFPIADGTVKLSGGEKVLKTSFLNRDRPDRGEEQGNFPRESDGSSPPLQDSSLFDGEARNDFWSFQVSLFIVITLDQESNCTCREKNHSP